MSIRTKRTTKRSFAAVISAALLASVLALVASPAGGVAAVDATVRKSGTDRYATAAAAADDGNTTETNFVLASGESFADGLAASGLAGALAGTLLLTNGDSLNETTLTKMSKMTAGNGANVVERVWVVGGTAAISTAATNTLTAAGYTVVRVSGADRYATADAVAAQMKLQGTIGTVSGYKTCMLASGTSWADAAAASGFAYAKVAPIFLTGPTLSAGTAAAMKSTGCQQVYVLGGTAAVSASAATDALAVSTVIVAPRLSGADRYATATAMAEKFATVDTNFRNSAVLVSGNDFPDALAASQYAAQQTSVILPVTDPMPSAISTWLGGKQAYMANIVAIGGTAAVPAALVTAAKTASTIAKPTCVVTATDGSTAFNVAWTSTATMLDGTGAGGAEVLTSYVRTSTSGAVATPYALDDRRSRFLKESRSDGVGRLRIFDGTIRSKRSNCFSKLGPRRIPTSPMRYSQFKASWPTDRLPHPDCFRYLGSFKCFACSGPRCLTSSRTVLTYPGSSVATLYSPFHVSPRLARSFKNRKNGSFLTGAMLAS